jgi:hypothetical protein
MSYRTFEVLDRDAVDDFGDRIVPYVIRVNEDGSTTEYYDFRAMNFLARYDFLRE